MKRDAQQKGDGRVPAAAKLVGKASHGHAAWREGATSGVRRRKGAADDSHTVSASVQPPHRTENLARANEDAREANFLCMTA